LCEVFPYLFVNKLTAALLLVSGSVTASVVDHSQYNNTQITQLRVQTICHSNQSISLRSETLRFSVNSPTTTTTTTTSTTAPFFLFLQDFISSLYLPLQSIRPLKYVITHCFHARSCFQPVFPIGIIHLCHV
jgi:hypothetical protein